MELAEKELLERLTPRVVRDDEKPAYYFFSRSGFSPQLEAAAASDTRCHLVAIDELLA